MLTVIAENRIKVGKSSSRCLRNNNKFPAIIYGKNIQPIYISIDHNIFLKIYENNKFDFNKISIRLNEKLHYIAKIKDIQKHPFKKKFLHIDFILK
ncbi:50S ribosomal protein L25 [Buchnera aphidicola (Thelaxes suberi)]|uniref:50S ribosomal protein L25 n=1 Tax=Buchnera aphidicola TaxID=9 RepID=UPI003464DAE9